MSEPLATSKIFIGGGFILTLAILFFRDNIVDNDMYQRTMHPDQWEQRQRDAQILTEKLNVIDRQECTTLMDARRQTIPLEIERNMLLGIGRNRAEKIESESFKLDDELCLKYGLSPYNRSHHHGE